MSWECDRAAALRSRSVRSGASPARVRSLLTIRHSGFGRAERARCGAARSGAHEHERWAGRKRIAESGREGPVHEVRRTEDEAEQPASGLLTQAEIASQPCASASAAISTTSRPPHTTRPNVPRAGAGPSRRPGGDEGGGSGAARGRLGGGWRHGYRSLAPHGCRPPARHGCRLPARRVASLREPRAARLCHPPRCRPSRRSRSMRRQRCRHLRGLPRAETSDGSWHLMSCCAPQTRLDGVTASHRGFAICNVRGQQGFPSLACPSGQSEVCGSSSSG